MSKIKKSLLSLLFFSFLAIASLESSLAAGQTEFAITFSAAEVEPDPVYWHGHGYWHGYRPHHWHEWGYRPYHYYPYYYNYYPYYRPYRFWY